MTDVKQFDGLPFFIDSGTRVSEDNLPDVQAAIERRTRGSREWLTRFTKGCEIRKSINSDEAGAVQNINMMYAYNAYFKFLHQSLLSLRDSFRLSTNNYRVDVERPTQVLKSYLEALQEQNDLLVNDAITYGCAAILLDININTGEPQPQIMVNRVKSAKLSMILSNLDLVYLQSELLLKLLISLHSYQSIIEIYYLVELQQTTIEPLRLEYMLVNLLSVIN